MKKTLLVILPILFVTLALFFPILIKPEILLERGNDLEEFFWPILYFIKKQILTNHDLPLWNNQILAGTPLLPDPQSQLFYLPNLIFLFFSIDTGFIISLFLHVFFAGIGMYLLAKHGFKFSKLAAIFTALIYLSTPKIAGYLEAGHYGLICFMTWIPFLFLSLIKITEEKNIKWSIFFAISLAGCFFTHSLSFIITAIASTIFFIYKFFEKRLNIKHVLLFSLGALFTFGLIAISFLPQISWQKETTRYLLLEKPDVYPKWNSILEPLKMVISPWKEIYSIDSEKWITFGTVPLIFSFLGFLKIKKEKKIHLLIFLLPILLISLNNASPIYSFLINQNWYKILRISTRIWFIPIVTVCYLAGFLFEKVSKGKLKFNFFSIFAALAIFESIGLSWTYFKKPINKPEFAPKEIYEFLSKDTDKFRVFCLTRCLSQKQAAIYNLELLDGYSTLQQDNFYKQSWQFVQSFWDYYSLSFPPMGLYLFEEIKPHAESLASYNVKYIISPFVVNDTKLELVETINNYYIYSNKLLLPRAYFVSKNQKPNDKLELSIYRPNNIQVKVSNIKEEQIVLSEIYSPGWKAFINGTDPVSIQENSISLRSIKISKNAKFIEYKYNPLEYKIGKLITISTVFIFACICVYQKEKTRSKTMFLK